MYEVVVSEVWVRLRYPGDFVGLAGAQCFIFVEAPDALQQALAAEDFVDAGNAAAEIVGGVEDCGIHIGDLIGHF